MLEDRSVNDFITFSELDQNNVGHRCAKNIRPNRRFYGRMSKSKRRYLTHFFKIFEIKIVAWSLPEMRPMIIIAKGNLYILQYNIILL